MVWRRWCSWQSKNMLFRLQPTLLKGGVYNFAKWTSTKLVPLTGTGNLQFVPCFKDPDYHCYCSSNGSADSWQMVGSSKQSISLIVSKPGAHRRIEPAHINTLPVSIHGKLLRRYRNNPSVDFRERSEFLRIKPLAGIPPSTSYGHQETPAKTWKVVTQVIWGMAAIVNLFAIHSAAAKESFVVKAVGSQIDDNICSTLEDHLSPVPLIRWKHLFSLLNLLIFKASQLGISLEESIRQAQNYRYHIGKWME